MRKRSRILYVAACLMFILSGCATGFSAQNGIHLAASGGNIKKMQDYLNQGGDVNAKDEDGWTLLMRAGEGGITEIVKLLIDKGADVNAKSRSGYTALMSAAGRGHLDIVKLLIAKGADINAKANNGSTLLMSAAEGGNIEIVNLFIDKGADVSAKDAEGNSVLMYAIPSLSRQIDLLHPDPLSMFYMVERRRNSANPAVVAKLIEKGADVNTKANDGTTALMLATWIENTETAQLLIKKGADVNAKANDGTTALMLALFYNNMALSNSLRQKGAIISCNTLITGYPGLLSVYVDDEKEPALTCFRNLSNGSHTVRILFLNLSLRQQQGATLSVNAKGNIYIVRYDLRNLKVWVDEISCDYGLTSTAELDKQSEPSSPKDYFSRGLDYAKKGQYGKAIEDFTKAIELDPKYGKAYMNRGIAYAKSGNSDKAGADFAQCCNIGFNKGCEASMQFIMGKPLNFTE
jgi:ankyrin repeat protein